MRSRGNSKFPMRKRVNSSPRTSNAFAVCVAYLDSMVEHAREHGYVETIFHRRRYIPELRDRNFNIRAFGERTAANSPIQGSAADLIKIAMIRIDDGVSGEARCRVECCSRCTTSSYSSFRPQEQDALVSTRSARNGACR